MNSGETYIKAVKWIFHYLCGIIDLKLVFYSSLKPLARYTDSDWAGNTITKHLTAEYVFSIDSRAISWSSKRQSIIALSSCKAEYMGETQAIKKAV